VTAPLPAPRDGRPPASERESPAPQLHADLLCTAAAAELARALITGDEHRALLAADTLWRSSGSPEAVYQVVSEQLAAAGDGWVQGFTSLAVAQRLTTAAQRLVAGLRPLPTHGGHGTVLLASPPDDKHTLGLQAFAHLVEDRGYRAVLGDGLPWEDLAELAEDEEDLVAICLSMHTEVGIATVRRGLTTLHQRVGAVPVIVGGPRVADEPTLARRIGADAAAATSEAGLQALAALTRHLTEREQEVLECVARGMTNNEAGEALGLGAATVKSHLDRIFLKTGTTQRAAAVATALRTGWLR
jgi:DNA-binding CsgD family transcriptional regulator